MEIRPMVIAPFDKFRFTWVIEKFSSLKKKQYSEIFTVGGCNWRLLIYPEGNAVEQLSIYLDVVDSTTLSIDWSIYAYFILAVVSQIHPKLTIKKETELTFNAKQSDWGFKSFIPLRDVRDPTKGYLVDDTLIVEAEFSARRVGDYWAYDSRKQRGFVELKNQGAMGQSEAVSPSQSSKVRLEKKQEEKGKKENAEAHLYTIIKVACDEDLADQIGKDIYFDLVNHDKVQTFRVQKQWVFTQFKEQVVKFFRIPVQHQRFWLWAKRQNNTYRPFRPITQLEESQSVGHLLVSTKAQCAELHLFLEVEHGLGLFQSPPERRKDDILLFFKLYDPEKATLRYVGRSFEKLGGKPEDCLMKLNEMAGFPPDTRIKLYEIEDGDIICFQRALTTDEEEQYRYPSVSSFLKYIHERWVVGGKARPDKHSISIINSQEREGEDLLERPGQHRRVEGVVEGELPVVQQREVQPEAPRDLAGKVMTAGQIATVLGDIARGLVPTDLEDPRWPSSAGGMTRTFAPMVRLADDFRALRGELERLRSRDEALIEATRLFGRGEGGARP